jgi:pyrroloquinoline quinone biosynthesis protein E
LYTNLITSGVGLNEKRLQELVGAGLEHVQLSFQDCREDEADAVAGTRSHSLKVKLARMIRNQKIAFTINIVVHRLNLDRLEAIIDFAQQLEPDRLEIANVQYYGWALRNREFLLPTREQVERSQVTVTKSQERVRGRMKIDYVAPDYYARYPKACMGGWGRRLILVDPGGRALPCHAAGVIPGLQFDNVREHSLEWIWRESDAFNRFRGEAMAEPCRSCDRRNQDFGGCRCQAFLLAGDASATDPVCSLAPMHSVVARELLQNGFHETSSDVPEVLATRNERWSYRVNAR